MIHWYSPWRHWNDAAQGFRSDHLLPYAGLHPARMEKLENVNATISLTNQFYILNMLNISEYAKFFG